LGKKAESWKGSLIGETSDAVGWKGLGRGTSNLERAAEEESNLLIRKLLSAQPVRKKEKRVLGVPSLEGKETYVLPVEHFTGTQNSPIRESKVLENWKRGGTKGIQGSLFFDREWGTLGGIFCSRDKTLRLAQWRRS